MGLGLKEKLRSLCCSNGWSYGVFWRFDQRNPMLLVAEDAFYVEEMGAVIKDMLVNVQIIGEGIIGEVASTGNHEWIFLDANSGSSRVQDMLQDNLEIRRQLSFGIKTIAVISMKSQGVIQFGSTNEILERAELLDQTRKVLEDLEDINKFLDPPTSLNYESYDLDEFFESLGDGNITPTNGCDFNELMDIFRSPDFMMHEPSSSLCLEKSQLTVESEVPCVSTWSDEGSILTSMDSFFNPEIAFQDPSNGVQMMQNLQDDSTLTSLGVNGELVNEEMAFQENSGSSTWNQNSADDLLKGETNLPQFPELKMDDFTLDLFEPCGLESLFESLPPSPDKIISSSTTNLLNSPFEQPANSVQRSITNAYSSGVRQKPENTNPVSVDKTLPTVGVGYKSGPRKGLFSELGIDELLDSISNPNSLTKSSIDYRLSATKRRRMESSSVGSNNQVQPSHDMNKIKDLLSKDNLFPKSQVGLWIDDSYSFNNGSATIQKPKNTEDPKKATKKRARPVENARPRPKDRQMIQDRLKELRGIIPDGQKCSIDGLLDRTVKHMHFLQSVTKYADKLQQLDEAKVISPEKRIPRSKNKMNGGSGGTTWAVEVGDQANVCPVIVDDLGPEGLMLVEILCEEQEFSLEIADVMKSFGLNILKGVMENRDDTLWARFIVEVGAHITRIDVLWFLILLLEGNGKDLKNQPGNLMNGVVPLPNNNHQIHELPCMVNIAETFQ